MHHSVTTPAFKLSHDNVLSGTNVALKITALKKISRVASKRVVQVPSMANQELLHPDKCELFVRAKDTVERFYSNLHERLVL